MSLENHMRHGAQAPDRARFVVDLFLSLRRYIVVVAVVLIAAGASAQSPFAPPPDVAAPPADAQKSESGLASKILAPDSTGEKPQATDIVTVHYTGWVAADGRMFDSSVARGMPSTFPLDRVMAGWRECVLLMNVGEKRRCWLPQDLAYRGQAGRPTGLVVFDIDLLETRRSPRVPPPDVKGPPDDAKRTATGLAYKVLRPGTGTRNPAAWSRVTVHYTGWTVDGKMFDSSVAAGMPRTFGLSDVIPGWTEGVALMVEGERTRFWIPEAIAYKGEVGQPRGMLVFDIDLIKIE
jgi:FKBP-type peptidyl-prolyl cis-trans isomerase